MVSHVLINVLRRYWPKINSKVNNGHATNTAHTRYATTAAAPPFDAITYGNLQTFPVMSMHRRYEKVRDARIISCEQISEYLAAAVYVTP